MIRTRLITKHYGKKHLKVPIAVYIYIHICIYKNLNTNTNSIINTETLPKCLFHPPLKHPLTPIIPLLSQVSTVTMMVVITCCRCLMLETLT